MRLAKGLVMSIIGLIMLILAISLLTVNVTWKLWDILNVYFAALAGFGALFFSQGLKFIDNEKNLREKEITK